ncbi:MAG: histidine kinase [Sulfurisoma sp.]|nr:histidine kinase [Sulfurisoma sp.]
MAHTSHDASINLLMIAAAEERAEAVSARLSQAGMAIHSVRVATPTALRSALREQAWDGCIYLHGETAMSASIVLKAIHQQGLDIPCLIVVTPQDERAAIRAMKAGTHDVVSSDRLDRLAPALEREIREARHRAEHRAALEMLKDSEARFRALASSLPGMVFQLLRESGGDFRFLFVGDGCHRLLGIKQHEILYSAKRFFDAFEAADRRRLEDAFAASAQSGLPLEWEGRLKGRARGRWISLSSTPRHGDHADTVWQGIASDISESKEIEAQLRRSREQLSELSSHLEVVREEERERIARDIHDEIGSLLVAIKIETNLLTAKLPATPAGPREKAQAIGTLLDQAMATASRVARELRPGILKEFGLAEAVRCQADDFAKRFGITCRVQCDDEGIEPDPDTSLALFRIVQETLTNIAKHAHASLVVLRMRRENGSISLEIRDNGRGISEGDLAKPKSFGLRGIRERVHSLAGDFSVAAGESGGTHIALRVPERRDVEPARDEEDLQRNLF